MKHIIISILTALLVVVGVSDVKAEQSKRLGPWEVHYNAFNSTLLRPEMAKQYQLSRSETLATLNISVLDATAAGKPAQQVEISGYVMNPLSQQQTLEFNEVIEGDAIYYLAQTRFSNLETLRFFITIKQGNQTQELRFHKEFWSN
ncbi:DUF4426 domain-containing protein [Pseudidiomarina marina]|uniref:DUF4426 domain-containing protein n=1 Tax=Pseudidiomarina marina TaxID=502366 RepID=A0A432YIF6_9GAMM|nr:DUF4426 domain-containing protein [Pseudidiomarina marina]PHR64469.1 MAG: hypothetical protein COA51_07960 [Idiomarina sp.]RUO60734.1 DUF4426 domain-containing protein [Pseudidiomarina marina]